jgi:hypothetical protein
VLAAAVLSTSAPRQPTNARGVRLAAATKAADDQGETIAAHVAGRLANQSTDPSRWLFSGELRSLATQEKIGTMTHEMTCLGIVGLPCPVVDAVTTFQFTDGTIVNRATVSIALDPERPGFAHIGSHPSGRSIVSGTGAFTGRSGKAHMSGHHDGREAPAHVTFDDFWLIELDPRGDIAPT